MRNRFLYVSSNVGIGTIRPIQKFQIGSVGSSGEGNVFVVTSDSEVGIGTTTPISKLDVRGDAYISGVVTASQFSTGVSGIGVNITTNTISGPSILTIDPAAVGDNTGAVRIKGDLYVDGTQFIVNSTTIELADFRIGIGTTATSDDLLNGAGIGIGSASNQKTLTWNNSSTALKSSEDFDVASGKVYKISGTSVLSNDTLGSGVLNSSLTSLGTIANLVSTNGTITNLTGTAGTITTLNSTNGTITNLTGTAGTITTFNSTNGTITNLTGTAGTITTLNSTNGTITNLSSTNINASGIVTATSGFVGSLTGLASSATQLATGRTVAITGDIAYTSGSFDGTGNVTGTGTLATVNGNIGTFGSQTLIPVVTVNAKGLVTAVTTAAVGTALTVSGDSGSVDINLLDETLTISGGTNLTSVGSGNTVTVNLDDNISLTSIVVGSGITINSSGINASAGIITATTFVGALTGTASNVTTNANLTGDVTSIGNATSIAAGVIVDADINASAGIVDTKLATISTALKVSNSATTATNANTNNAIVARDASGNFSAGTITANLTGTATSTTNIPNLTGAITSNNTTTSLGSFTSANLSAALTDETGSGSAVFATSPTLVTPVLGAASATSIVVSSGSTFTNGPILVGTSSSTGTASQTLQVTGGAYVSGSLGIGITIPSQTGNTSKVHISGGNLKLDGNNQLIWDGTYPSYINGSSGPFGNIQFNAGNDKVLQYTANTVGSNISDLSPNTTQTIDLGRSSLQYRNTWIGGNLFVGTATSTGTASQRLQVTGGAYVSGNLGLGTTNPESLLHINGDATAFRVTRGSSIGFVYNTGTAVTDPFRIQSNGGPVDLYSAAGYPITFSAGTTEKSRIDSSGNLGIGITNPSSKLSVYGDLASGSSSTSGSSHALIISGYNSSSANHEINFYGHPNGTNDSITWYLNRAGGAYGNFDVKFNGISRFFIAGASLSNSGNITLNPVNNTVISSGNLLIGTVTSTGTASQPLQVTGGAYVSGNVGIGTDNPTYKLHVNGSFAATTKSFVIDHPTKPNYKLRYASLEGPSNDIFIRGRTTENIIELPEYWTELVDKDSITVNLTPIRNKNIWVEDINNNKVYIDSDSSIDCFYTVFAERKDVEKLVVEIEGN